MDAKLKAKWVRALRSGKYRQTDGQLRKETAEGGMGYCCLGVLCEIAPGVEFDEIGVATLGNQEIGQNDFDGGGGLKHFGIPRRVHDRLVQLNDGLTVGGKRRDPKSFSEIADWIEKSKQL